MHGPGTDICTQQRQNTLALNIKAENYFATQVSLAVDTAFQRPPKFYHLPGHKLHGMPLTTIYRANTPSALDLPCKLKLDASVHTRQFPQLSPRKQTQPIPNEIRREKGNTVAAHMGEASGAR